MKSYNLILIGFLCLLASACSKTQFSSALADGNALVAADTTPTTPTTPNTPTPSVPDDSRTPDSDSSDDHDDSHHSCNDSLVECSLGEGCHSVKIVLAASLVTGANHSSSRLCMSKNACLKIINAYAQARNCSLSAGKPTTLGSKKQCVSAFPGSSGSCRNAQVISDAQVEDLLTKMSQRM